MAEGDQGGGWGRWLGSGGCVPLYSHVGQQGVAAGHGAEVGLQEADGAGQRHVSAAAEQRHAREAQDGGHQRGVRDPAQALDAALEAACRGRHQGAELDTV